MSSTRRTLTDAQKAAGFVVEKHGGPEHGKWYAPGYRPHPASWVLSRQGRHVGTSESLKDALDLADMEFAELTAPAASAPMSIPAPGTLTDVLRPYCTNADDADLAADIVRDTLRARIQAALTALAPRLPWTTEEKATQSYGFDSRDHRDLEGATLYGTVTYPERAVRQGAVRVLLQKHWSAALAAGLHHVTARAIDTDAIPYVPAVVLPIVQDALADWSPEVTAREIDVLEDHLWNTGAIEDDSETEYTDTKGDVIETHEGVSARFRFRFDLDRTAPPPTATLDENGALLIRVRVPLTVHLSRIYSPWDRSAQATY